MDTNNLSGFVSELEKAGVQFREEGGVLKLSAPKGAVTAEARTVMSEHKEAILQLLHHRQQAAYDASAAITAAPRSGAPIPLSFAQERLWYLSRLEGEDAITYNMPAALLLEGELQQAVLNTSLNYVVQRHEVLRTTFQPSPGGAYQHIAAAITLAHPYTDLRSLSADEQANTVQQLVTAESRTPFDITKGPLIRYQLLQLEDRKYVFVVTLHHIISDGWFIDILVKELSVIYAALVKGETQWQLPALPVQYADFTLWQRKRLSGPSLEHLLAFWRQQLQGIPTLMDLPTDRPRPAVQSFNGALENYTLDQLAASGIQALCRQYHVTPFMVMISAYAIVLARWSGRDDIVIGSVIANRNYAEMEHLIGFFVNSLVLRIRAEGNLTFEALLGQVRETALEAFDHQDLPFEKLVEELSPERSLSHSPLFQVAFAWQNTGNDQLQLPGLTISDWNAHNRTAKYDLTFFAGESDNTIAGTIEYNTDIFEAATIRRFIHHFQQVVSAVVQTPQLAIAGIPFMNAAETQQVLEVFSGVEEPMEEGTSFLHLFQKQVALAPEAIAIRQDHVSITYEHLQQQSHQLAALLLQQGLQPAEKVGVMAGRSIYQVIGMLAVFKAGGCYVPFDPDYPATRLQWMAGDAGIRTLITTTAYENLPMHNGLAVMVADQQLPAITTSLNLPAIARNHPAYMIYTSGSTGLPKGVILAHGGFLNMVRQQVRQFQVTGNSKVLQFASPGFDASVSEYGMALASGGCLVMVAKEQLVPLPSFTQLLESEGITHVTLIPGFLAMLPYARLPLLSSLIVAGEACSLDLLQKWGPGRQFFNAYGPTESTVCTTIAHCHSEATQITIGRPIANIQVYILDKQEKPCPIGVSGELYIGGCGVAIGYHQRSELNSQKFREITLNGSTLRLYRSGDSARFLANGDIAFEGRIDEQVKIRGFRIEPGEIESVLRTHPLVKEAAIVVSEDITGDKKLFAYVCANEASEQDTQALLEGESLQEQVGHWREIFDDSYGKDMPVPEDAAFNISGWNSSYTGLPIPGADMREWVNNTIEDIKAWQPKEVLEIGCGSGLLLLGIAPHCEYYLGTDFSANAIASLQPVVQQRHLTQVQLQQCDARDLATQIHRQFDMIVLNSVIQYFPDSAYLQQVLEGALRLLKPGGHFFIGDVRNLALRELFHSSIAVFKYQDSLDTTQLARKVALHAAEEEELLVHPQFFASLPAFYPEVSGVKTLVKRGWYDNELSRFRYDVILEKKGGVASLPALLLDSAGTATTPAQLAALLPATVTGPVIIRGIRNKRLQADVQAMAAWQQPHSHAPLVTLPGAPWLHPEACYEWAQDSAYRVEVQCSLSDATVFDVCFIPASYTHHVWYHTTDTTASNKPLQEWVNQPIQKRFQQKLIYALKGYLAQRLPEYMVPALFEIRSTLPFTPNGKLDRAALKKEIALGINVSTKGYAAPRNPREKELVLLWEALLQVSPVGIYDHFFEVGGHSLLAVQLINRINDAFHCQLSLVELFNNPDIASLAQWLAAGNNPATHPLLVPFSEQGAGAPLFLVPGAGGNALQLGALGLQFKHKRPCYGLSLHRLPEGVNNHAIVVIAHHNIAAMKAVQPTGPYHLAGHSSGGWIAWEMARQLEAAGESIAFLGMLDSAAPSANTTGIGEGWKDTDWLQALAALHGLTGLGSNQPPEAAEESAQLLYVKQLLEAAYLLEKSEGMEKLMQLLLVLKATLGQKYTPTGKLSATVHLFVAKETAGDSALTDTWQQHGGWNQLAQEVQQIAVAGNHFSMLQEAHAAALAVHITQILEHNTAGITGAAAHAQVALS